MSPAGGPARGPAPPLVETPPGYFYDGPTFVAETAARLGPVFRRRLEHGVELEPEAGRAVIQAGIITGFPDHGIVVGVRRR